MTRNGRRHVVIVGGGISGLAAAFYVRELSARRGFDLRVTVIERAQRVGGCIETLRGDGFIMEMGAESLPTEKPWAIELVTRLDLRDELIPTRAEHKGTHVVRGGRLRAIPEDFALFTPTSIASLIGSGIFSPAGLMRAAMELLVPARRSEGDESLASFVTRRFGREVLDRLAQPLIAGIYSADPRRLSMRATLPRFLDVERRHGSLIRGLGAARRANASSPAAGSAPHLPRLVSLRTGLGTMVDALERELRETLLLGHDVLALQHGTGSDGHPQWFATLADGRTIEADALIFAASARCGARIFRCVDPRLATLLASINYNSIAVITLAYGAEALAHVPRGYGFVVPYVEGRSITAATIASQKYEGRAPSDALLVRTFIGGGLQEALLDVDDQALINAACRDLHDLLGIPVKPRLSMVKRWPRALPEYAVGHVDLVNEIDRRAATLPCFALAGSAYRGVGVSDCVRSGQTAAEAVVTALSSPRVAFRS